MPKEATLTRGSKNVRKKKAPSKKPTLKRTPKAEKPEAVAPATAVKPAPVAAPVVQPKPTAPVVFTGRVLMHRHRQHKREFGGKFEIGRTVKVIHVVDRKGTEEVALRGIIKRMTSAGAYCYDPVKDRSGQAPEWFPFNSKMCRIVLD